MKVDLERLKEGIKKSGVRQRVIAECAGVGAPSMSNMLRGKQKLTADVFLTVCDMCRIDPASVAKRD